MELKYIDIGLNLMGKQFDSDRETVAADSFAAGVGFIVTGTDLKSDRAAVDYLKKSRFEHGMVHLRNFKGLPRRNVPVNIKYVAEKIAAVKNTDVEAVEQAALRNTRQFFNL